jgi:hypothetical protein
MTLTKILDTFKTKLNLPKVMNPLERAADFYGGSSKVSEGNESRDLNDNPDINSISDAITVLH